LRTVIAEVSARDDVLSAFSGDSAPVFRERRIAERLHHISIDPQHAMQEYLADQLPVRALAEMLVSSRVFTYLTAATPGMRELLTIGKVWELAQADRRTQGAKPYDLVVLDAPATGHGLAILSAPRTFAQAARVGPIARQGKMIDALLSDPRRTGVVGVATPEEMPVNEVLAMRSTLRAKVGLQLDAVVANGMLPARLTAAQAVAVDAAIEQTEPGAVRHALHTARSQHARAKAQRSQLQRLRKGAENVPVITLPQVAAASLGAPDFEALGRRLAGKLG
jgi:anion-transporting  ArsA/GET3 family ATPase